MTQAQLEVRKGRSENGALIASATEEGFRVYAVRNPSKLYLVKKEGDQWTCTCPDFEFHKSDSTWRCKHVLAVAPWPKPEETLPVEVEFDDPTQGLGIPESPAPDQVRRERVRKEAATPEPGNGHAKPVSTRMIDIGKVNGKWGERLRINVQVGDRRCRLFGSADQLALQIARAGFHMNPEDIEDGRRLNVACLVVTKPSDDGKYLNIARVVSLPKKGGNDGRAN